jgi:polyhydroxyalkanoate synthase
MPTLPGEVVSRIRREVTRSEVRARNGLKHVSGSANPAVGCTAKSAVWSRDNVVLYRYDAERRTRGTPILLVMSLVTKPYVFDLQPGNSLVEDLLSAGFDVFLLDWGVPGPVDAHNGLERYCDLYIPRAVNETVRAAGADGISVIGYCLGAILALLSAAGNRRLPIRNMVSLAAPVDIGMLGPVANLLSEGRLEPEHLVDETGNVPPDLLMTGLRLFQPTVPLTTYANLWQSLGDDEALAAHNALIGWSSDQIPFPGKAFGQTVDLFLRRDLLLTGKVPLGNRIVDMSSIRFPVLNVFGSKDKMVPPESSEQLSRVLCNANVEPLLLNAGHSGLFVGRQARKQTVPKIVAWLTENERAEVAHDA